MRNSGLGVEERRVGIGDASGYGDGLGQLLSSAEIGPLLSPYVFEYLEAPPTIEQLWRALDQVWDDLRVDSSSEESLARYYAHPVWLFNGLVVEHNAVCDAQRVLVVRLAEAYRPARVLDFGGGTGALLKIAHGTLGNLTEAHLLETSSWKNEIARGVGGYEKIRIVEKVAGPYDVVFCTEVMEHLCDPFGALFEINKCLRTGGAVIGTWSFFPMMKAHLPRNFHLAEVFHRLSPLMGFSWRKVEGVGQPIFVLEKFREAGEGMPRVARQAALLLKPAVHVVRRVRAFPRVGP